MATKQASNVGAYKRDVVNINRRRGIGGGNAKGIS